MNAFRDFNSVNYAVRFTRGECCPLQACNNAQPRLCEFPFVIFFLSFALGGPVLSALERIDVTGGELSSIREEKIRSIVGRNAAFRIPPSCPDGTRVA